MTELELRQKYVNTAKSYLHSYEGGAKHKDIIDTYNAQSPLPRGYKVTYTDAWCATFVSAMAIKAGIKSIMPLECSCTRQVAMLKDMGCWVENDGYVPTLGDLIYYDWLDSGSGDDTSAPDHVGIVCNVSNGYISVIEGNKKDNVEFRDVIINGRYIRGFGVPKYASLADGKSVAAATPSEGDENEVKLKELEKGDKGNSVKALQILLIGNGYSCGSKGADGSFGPATLTAVKKYQKAKGLSVDGVVGSKTWSSLLR